MQVEHIVGPGGDTVSELVKSTGADVNISASECMRMCLDVPHFPPALSFLNHPFQNISQSSELCTLECQLSGKQMV